MAGPSIKMIDPDGDIIIVLVPHSKNSPTPANAAATTGNPHTPMRKKPQFRVSSDKLRPISPALRQLVEEAKKDHVGDSPCKIEVSGFDPDAFAVVMGILHERLDDIPDKPDLVAVRNIGVIAQHFQCLEQVKRHSGQWLMLPDRPEEIESFCQDEMDLQQAVYWLFVSLVFHDKPAFAGATQVLIEQSTGLLETHLPIPDRLIGDIYERRISMLRQISSTKDIHGYDETTEESLKRILDELWNVDHSCHYKYRTPEQALAAQMLARLGVLEADEDEIELSAFGRQIEATVDDAFSKLGGFKLLDDGSWDTGYDG